MLRELAGLISFRVDLMRFKVESVEFKTMNVVCNELP
jgi:hypothetical protein